jgi:membrane protease YdiL (CAAX protease family)
LKEDRYPSAWQAFGLVLALFLAEVLASVLLVGLRKTLSLSRSELDVFATLLGNAMVFTYLVQKKGLSYRALFHASRASVRATFVLLLPPILLLVPALVLAVSALMDFMVSVLPLSRWEEQLFQRLSAGNVATVVAVCILAPVLEEMLFRGIILRSFLNQYSRGKAIYASAFLFGMAHLNIYQFVSAFLLGLLSGWLYERSRSLLPCIALHAGYNSTVVALSAAAASAGPQDSLDATLLTWVFALAGAALGAGILRRLLLPRPLRTRA